MSLKDRLNQERIQRKGSKPKQGSLSERIQRNQRTTNKPSRFKYHKIYK